MNINEATTDYDLVVNLTTIIGPVSFSFDIPQGEIDVIVTWNNVEVVNQVGLSGQTSVSFTKTLNNPTNAFVTIRPNANSVVAPSYTATFNCPEADSITVKQIVINFAGDASLTTTTRYRWQLASDTSPYSTNSVVLEEDGVSLFNEVTGPESFGSIPPSGATVYMQNRQEPGNTFVFDPTKDKFKYLESPTNYNEVDINTLIPLLNTATPITTSGIQNEASFTYVGGEEYLYLVWDLREPTPIELCYDNSSPTDACCDCQPIENA